jgi:hypothetical protein
MGGGFGGRDIIASGDAKRFISFLCVVGISPVCVLGTFVDMLIKQFRSLRYNGVLNDVVVIFEFLKKKSPYRHGIQMEPKPYADWYSQTPNPTLHSTLLRTAAQYDFSVRIHVDFSGPRKLLVVVACSTQQQKAPTSDYLFD